jgi:hypothetical protein
MTQAETFWQAYGQALAVAVEKNPADYALRPDETAQAYAAATAAKMQRAVEASKDFGRVNYRDSKAFRAAAKAVNVPFTREGLNSIYA